VFNWEMVTAYNVIARLTGSRYPDEWVIRGNHFDAWNQGAEDPLSGQVSMLAEAQAVAGLAKAGRRPLRTMIYAAWDGEEPGLIGSTEWAEEHATELQQHTVAYINTDGNGRGFINIGGSHTLEHFFNQVIADVDDPHLGVSLKARARAYKVLFGADEASKAEARERPDLRLYPLGSGSDFTPFLQHLGIAAFNLGFEGESEGGSYHTLYDTYEHFTTWGDPGLAYGVALAKVTGRAALRLANAPRLPFEFKGLADSIAKYVKQLQTLADKLRKSTDETNQLIHDGTYDMALNPYKTLGPPALKAAVPHFDFAPLLNARDRLQQAANRFDTSALLPADSAVEINRLLYTSEHLLTREGGLEGRPWYKHFIYAPGFYTGYGVKTIPGVREAIEQRNYSQVNPQIKIAANVLVQMAERIELLNSKIGN